MASRLVARWESRSGKWFVDLFAHDDGGYSFKADGAGGNLGRMASDEAAIQAIERRVNDFQPDSAKTPMQRVRSNPDVSVEYKETVDGEWMILVNGYQWGPPGSKPDRSGAYSATFPTKAAARAAFMRAVRGGEYVHKAKGSKDTINRALAPPKPKQWYDYRNNPKPASGHDSIYDPKHGLLAMLGLPTADDLIERNQDYIGQVVSETVNAEVDEGKEFDDGGAEDRALEVEREVSDSIYRAWQKSVEAALDQIEETTGVVLTPKWDKDKFDVGAKGDDWEKVARQLIQIINGVGYAHAGSNLKEALHIEGVRTARQFVLRLWAAVRDYPAVYGTTSHERIYERALEDYMRNI